MTCPTRSAANNRVRARPWCQRARVPVVKNGMSGTPWLLAGTRAHDKILFLIQEMQRGHAHPVWGFKNIKGTRGGVVVRWDTAISIVGQTSFQTVYKDITSEIIVWMLFSIENWYFQKPASATTVIGNCLAKQFPVHGSRLYGFQKCLFFTMLTFPYVFRMLTSPDKIMLLYVFHIYF